MRAETIRRLLVFGVCALGVSALYLVPAVTHAPDRAAQPQRHDAPGPQVRPISTAPAPATTSEPSIDTIAATIEERSANPSTAPTRVTDVRVSDEPRRGTPSAPAPVRDSTPPEPVPAVRLDRATNETATISWSRSFDDVGVTAYRVWLNGYVVSTTRETSATVRWFNDDSNQQIVQVRAVDAAGNQSERAASLLADRPTPTPTPTPTDTPTESASTSAGPAPAEALAPTESTTETPR